MDEITRVMVPVVCLLYNSSQAVPEAYRRSENFDTRTDHKNYIHISMLRCLPSTETAKHASVRTAPLITNI